MRWIEFVMVQFSFHYLYSSCTKQHDILYCFKSTSPTSNVNNQQFNSNYSHLNIQFYNWIYIIKKNMIKREMLPWLNPECFFNFVICYTTSDRLSLFSTCTKLIQTNVCTDETRCPEYKMSPHQENGAKLKKETHCPCTYKNKLILCVSSHRHPFLSGPKDSHVQTEASLAFLHTCTANHNHLCTHNGQWEKVYVHLTR